MYCGILRWMDLVGDLNNISSGKIILDISHFPLLSGKCIKSNSKITKWAVSSMYCPEVMKLKCPEILRLKT